ncbi:MAG: hypothetical protein NTX57_10180 [Armatimonadetes bacterium]|jgi:hypothetical protein|nr:hypothetical protein [Armatimonadota bacterium]
MEVPDEVFDDQEAFEAFMAQVGGGNPRRDGEALIGYLNGWLTRHEGESGESEEKKDAARRLISELQAGLDSLYAQDVVVARLEDELDMLRERQEQHIGELRVQFRKMVFWRGRNDADVLAAIEWVQQEFSPELAIKILDTEGLFDSDIPQE